MITAKQVAVLIRRAQVVAHNGAPVARRALQESLAEMEAQDEDIFAQGVRIRTCKRGTPLDNLGLFVPRVVDT